MNGEAPAQAGAVEGPTLDEDLDAIALVLRNPWSTTKRFRVAEVAFNRVVARLKRPAPEASSNV